jgi:hypothetical protein
MGEPAIPVLLAEIDVGWPYTTRKALEALPRVREREWAKRALSTPPMCVQARTQVLALMEKRLPDTPDWPRDSGALAAEVAASVFVSGSTKADIPLYTRWLGDRNPILRRWAAAGLTMIRDPDATFLLTQALNDSDWIVCGRAAMFLGGNAGPEAVPALQAMIDRLQALPGYQARDTAEQARDAIRRIGLREARQHPMS